MQFRIKTCALILICCLVSPATFAEEEEYRSSMIFNSGKSRAQSACDSPWLSATYNKSCGEFGTTFRLAYHYQITPRYGFEVSYGDLGSANGNGTSLAYGTPASWELKATGPAIAGTARFRVASKFSLLAKAGIVHAKFRESFHTYAADGTPMQGTALNGIPIIQEAKNAFTFGVGAQYEFTPRVSLRIQYENFGRYDIYSAYHVSAPPRMMLSVLSGGLVFRFY